MELVELSFEEVEQKLLQGEVKVMGWVAMIAMGLLSLKGIS
jgi:Na+/H+ antiporter NhaC